MKKIMSTIYKKADGQINLISLTQEVIVNAKYAFTVKLMEQWGYKLVDSITWVKKTVNGKIAKVHGYYLQHAK
jgi:N6-adenosine-specific RNA methylase IME4